MEQAYLNRDATYDGVFFLGVRTTGVFCRPSCPARKPLPQNVNYFAAPRDAIMAGYRPCKRCEPLNVQGALPAWIRQLIADIEHDPTQRLTDADLRVRNLEPARVWRYFLKNYGVTFHAYCRGRRMSQALTQLQDGVALAIPSPKSTTNESGFCDTVGVNNPTQRENHRSHGIHSTTAPMSVG